MNRSKLKTYAPQARRDFIQAVTDRAAVYGLTKDNIQPISERGDVAIIGGTAFPRAIADKRKRLEERIQRHGFDQVMEAMAYTWFNRLVAIRFMELHGYFDHGYRVLSNPDPSESLPEIVEHAEHVDLLGLDKEKVIVLKLDGTKEAELYRMLLIAQCNALQTAMPFLFERIDDETELLLPDNLLHSDSLVRKLVTDIEEEDWQQVEIIGWLYQFYISDKKDEVIGKVVKSEDIPAATQLFTPNWIVKYLVQNSLGRQWLATNPNSSLRDKMEFFIEPIEQSPDVQEKLKAITPSNLNPEELTLMDPACGSGHILVEAYDLLKHIYLERGYRLRDIPRLILSKNLFGLEIDERAAQLAAFALMMKARSDAPRLFDADVQPNVLAIQESNGVNVNAIVQAFTQKKIASEGDPPSAEFRFMGAVRAPLFATENSTTATVDEKLAADLKVVLELFVNAKTYGSLITVPPQLVARLPALTQAIEALATDDDFVVRQVAATAKGSVLQAALLAGQYDAVVTNPPYINSKALNAPLKRFVAHHYPNGKADLFAAFMLRAPTMTKAGGSYGFMTPFVWMFISSFEALRIELLKSSFLWSLVQPEYHAFFDSAFVPICAFIAIASQIRGRGTYFDLSQVYGAELQPVKLLEGIRNPKCAWRYSVSPNDFCKLPGSPIAYNLSREYFAVFDRAQKLGDVADVKEGLNTGNNALFFRFWFEIGIANIGFDCADSQEARASGKKWFPCNKGGGYRRWYGNNENVINWERDGDAVRNFRDNDGKVVSAVRNAAYYFRPGLTWSGVGASGFSVRRFERGYIFNSVGRSLFPKERSDYILGFLNSTICSQLLGVLSPTLNFSVGDVARLPILFGDAEEVESVQHAVEGLVEIAKGDWNSTESAWDFYRSPLVSLTSMREAFIAWTQICLQNIARTKELEEKINAKFAAIYAVEARTCVGDDAIALYRPDRREDARRLVSYFLGCAMGRYSLDKPGLIYANCGNDGFNPSEYKSFPADKDGIIPVTEIDWFPDDVSRRFEEFVGVAWPKEHLEENVKFVADSLGPRNGEQPRDTIRRYFADDCYKHHLQTYKRRPIYWLFTSGKLGAFQCLVYLHRYNEGTLARMRTEYVIPLQGKINGRIGQLDGDITKATSTAHRKRLEKEQDLLKKQQAELLKFDEKLRHYADLRIKLDLDDGVKVNYGKFGDLLAEVKAVCGKAEDDE